MVLGQSILGGVTAIQALPLQLGGDLIGLAILFLILAVVAIIFGAKGIAGLSMDIAKWLVIIFIVLAIVSFIL